MTHGSLFSGIGGFDLAAEWAGWTNLFHCEINPFCQQVLKHHFPNAEQFSDITKSDFSKYRGKIDIITGGFPCQPFSAAGKRNGTEDSRHLWPAMLAVIRDVAPRWVVGENVFGIINWSNGLVFEQVQADLEAEGYEVQAYVLPACAVNAPHKRDRTWFVAHAFGIRLQTSNRKFRQINRISKKTPIDFSRNIASQWDSRNRSTGMLFRDNGLPKKLDGITFSKWRNESIKAAGNAIVSQVVFQIFKAINEYERLN